MNNQIHLITYEFPPTRGGAGRYCYELAFHSSNKENLTIWTPRKSEEINDIKSIRLSWKCTQGIFSSWKLIWKIKKHFKNKQETPILHFAEPGSLRAFIRFGWILGDDFKVLITIHGSELLRFCRNPVERSMFKKCLENCERVHVLSKYNQRKLLVFLPTIKRKIVLISGAPSSNITKNTFSKKYNNNKIIKIICVARIHPRKGQDKLLHSLIDLPIKIQSNLVVYFAGPIIDEKFFKSVRILSNNFEGKVIFEGDCSDQKLAFLYSDSDIFALTPMEMKNSIEGFGLVYMEASSFGLPVIANRTGGIQDAVLENKTGIIADPQNLNSLTEAFDRLITDHKLRKKLGENGKKWAKSHNWQKVSNDFYSFTREHPQILDAND